MCAAAHRILALGTAAVPARREKSTQPAKQQALEGMWKILSERSEITFCGVWINEVHYAQYCCAENLQNGRLPRPIIPQQDRPLGGPTVAVGQIEGLRFRAETAHVFERQRSEVRTQLRLRSGRALLSGRLLLRHRSPRSLSNSRDSVTADSRQERLASS